MTPVTWLQIRAETEADHAGAAILIGRVFAGHPHSSGTEASIVQGLRAAGALAVALVAEDDAGLAGHVAYSPVTVDGRYIGWAGLGPLAVHPRRQNQGVGAALVAEGLARVRARGARGCVVMGDPAYYGRFGFRVQPGLVYPGPPPDHFLALSFTSDDAQDGLPKGTVAYHAAFSIDAAAIAQRSGSCLCGRIGFTVSAPLQSASACHCRQCRKQSGHVYASANVAKSAVTVVGAPHLRWHQASAKVRRGFCDTCGSWLFWDPLERDWTSISLGAFDTPTGVRLERHIFVSDRGDYYDLADGLPRHPQ